MEASRNITEGRLCLDEAQVGFAIKKAVKAEIYELCDKKIQPWFKERDEERGGQLDDDTNFNR